MEPAVRRILESRLTKLHGDASYRTYYRAHLEEGRTVIVMKLPEGLSSVSEEITNLKEKPKELPFINISRCLKGVGLPVPEIFHYAEDEGILILEDFGDESLAKRIDATPEEKETWYRKAIELLVSFQRRGTAEGVNSIAHQRSFDETLLNWEFQHFLEYAVEARLGIKIPEDDLKTLRRLTGDVASAIVQFRQTLTHRDFQSRNLMIHEGVLKLIDFQDALIGPLPYDLVALLRDSYVVLDPELVSRLISYYLKIREKETGEKLDPVFFRKMFDVVSVQRKLKDAGRFVYIDRVKKNPSFLPFIPTSLGYVREALERQSELKQLFDALKKYVPEFQ